MPANIEQYLPNQISRAKMALTFVPGTYIIYTLFCEKNLDSCKYEVVDAFLSFQLFACTYNSF